MAGWFELVKSSDGQYFFKLVAKNRSILLTSELYRTKQGATEGIDLVDRNRNIPARYQIKKSSSSQRGGFYFLLSAENGRIIGVSPMYTSQEACALGISQVMERDPPDLTIQESSLVSSSRLGTPMAFISHDSRDKESLVRELAFEMIRLECPVWYDEYSLFVGDSLRASIERGLREARKCVVVLSPNYLTNSGWGIREFDSIFNREILEKRRIILPVWHKVSAQEVYEFSPVLADRVALNSSIGIQELAKQLVNAIVEPRP